MVAVALFDLAAGAFSMWAAVLLRYRFEPDGPPEQVMLQSVTVFALACAIVFPLEGLHRGLWRYTALNDAEQRRRIPLVGIFAPLRPSQRQFHGIFCLTLGGRIRRTLVKYHNDVRPEIPLHLDRNLR